MQFSLKRGTKSGHESIFKTKFGSSFSLPALVVILSGLAFAVISASSAATFQPPTKLPPYSDVVLPSALNGIQNAVGYWETTSKLGSTNGMTWNNTTKTLAVNKIKITGSSTTPGSFLKAADASGAVTWNDIYPAQFQKKLIFPAGGTTATTCPAGKAITNIDTLGNVTCSTVAAPFAYTLSQSGISPSTVTAGNTAANTLTAALTGTSGPAQSVAFSIGAITGGTGGVSASISPSSCTPTISGCQVVVSVTTSSAASGTYTIPVSSTGGSVSVPLSFTLTVNPGVQFTLKPWAFNSYSCPGNFSNYEDGYSTSFPQLKVPSGSCYISYFLKINNTAGTTPVTVTSAASPAGGGFTWNWYPSTTPPTCAAGASCDIGLSANFNSSHYRPYITTITITATNGTTTVPFSWNINVQ